MKKVGELVQEAIDFMNSGLAQYAIIPTVAAIAETAKSVGGCDEFIRENWDLIAFMGLPRALPLPLKISFGAKRIFPQLNINADAQTIILFLIRETLAKGKMPDEFAFHSNGEFEIKDNKIFLPESLISGLLGVIIVHPENKNEQIGEKYWMNISDFKMFISELWGRRDLAERIMKFYLE